MATLMFKTTNNEAEYEALVIVEIKAKANS